MREYLKKVLELVRPYRVRFGLGLLCGFLSGVLAPTLGLSLKLAVDAVFPPERGTTNSLVVATASSPAPATNALVLATTNSVAAAPVVNAPGLGPAEAGTTNLVAAAPATSPPGLANKGLASRLPAPLKKKLDGLVKWFRPSDHPSPLRLVLVIAFIPTTMFLRSLLAYLNIYLLSWVGIRAANDLRVRLFKHMMNLPLGFFGGTSTGDLMARIEGAMAVNGTINGSIGIIIREPISIIVLVASLVALQPLLTLFTLMVFPICLVPIVVFGRKFRKSNSAIHGKFANLAKVMHESFTGIRVIKAYNLETRVVEEFRQATEAVTSFFMRTIRAGELPGPLIEFLGSLGVAMVFAYFAFVPGHPPAGDMFAYFFLVFSLYAPLKNLSRLQHQLSLAQACVQPVYDLLAVQTTLPEPAQPKPLRASGAPIRFENISFSYGEKPVLHKINLTIQPGQFVALVGPTGSGKTSLANLLLRFYDPQGGAVLIGDTDIRAVCSRDLRANIAVVTQQTILFNESVRHNIGIGRPGATDAEIEAAARHAYAHDFIMEKPQGYDTCVGEKGVNLSGGQQQRLAIARAILKNAPILILDEATSSLDTESEQIVQAALEQLMQGRTTICIAHRLSTIRNADLIVVLESGRIIESGTHAELMKAGELYSKLYELSFEPPPPTEKAEA